MARSPTAPSLRRASEPPGRRPPRFVEMKGLPGQGPGSVGPTDGGGRNPVGKRWRRAAPSIGRESGVAGAERSPLGRGPHPTACRRESPNHDCRHGRSDPVSVLFDLPVRFPPREIPATADEARRPVESHGRDAGRSIVAFQLEHAFLEHLVGLDGQFPAGHFEVRGEGAGGNLLEDAQRGGRALVIADQDVRKLDPDL